MSRLYSGGGVVTAGRTYLNPVYPRSFPDPFVLKFRGEYWGYCTGFWNDGRAFGILHSRDLVEWKERAGAMEPLPGGHTCYWAPEVTYDSGRFYLYYSVGNEERMEIRVAVADHPGGPFVDSGRRLTGEPFAIDAHVFLDRDGTRWLFYATDFLTHSHIGTGTVRDRLLDPFTLAGDPRPVTLPRYDWHVYHPNRPEKGGVRWHTVEGPFVLERDGLYYQMFSGGNWQSPTYGVSYATSEEGPRSLEEWTQEALPILRTTGEVVGPGHNSVVRGPDNRQLWCVYHRWSPDLSARVLAIDLLDWEGSRMRVAGPSTTPQPSPRLPTVADFLDEPLILAAGGEHCLETGTPSFLLEVSARGLGEGAGFGLELRGEFLMAPAGCAARPSPQPSPSLAPPDREREPLQGMYGLPPLPVADGRLGEEGWGGEGPGGGKPARFSERVLLGDLDLPSDFDPRAVHLIRVEVEGRSASVSLDGLVKAQEEIPGAVSSVALVAPGIPAEFSALALTAL